MCRVGSWVEKRGVEKLTDTLYMHVESSTLKLYKCNLWAFSAYAYNLTLPLCTGVMHGRTRRVTTRTV